MHLIESGLACLSVRKGRLRYQAMCLPSMGTLRSPDARPVAPLHMHGGVASKGLAPRLLQVLLPSSTSSSHTFWCPWR